MIISCKNYIISSDEWAKLKGLFTYYVTRFNGFRSLHACSYSFNTESPNHTGKGISPEKNFTPTRSRHNSVRGRFYSYRQYIGSQPRTWYKSIICRHVCVRFRTLFFYLETRRLRCCRGCDVVATQLRSTLHLEQHLSFGKLCRLELANITSRTSQLLSLSFFFTTP